MSKINLPPYPIPHPVDGHRMFSASQVEAYVKKAVREALAAQEPVAWVIDARLGLSDPQFCWGNPAGIYKSLYVPLAIIPEFVKDPPCSPTSSTGSSQ